MMLDLTGLPDDPLLRLAALLELEDQLNDELEEAYGEAYFEARLTGTIDVAIAIKRHSRRHILRLTRRENVKRGRQVHWSDSLDPTSTAYSRE